MICVSLILLLLLDFYQYVGQLSCSCCVSIQYSVKMCWFQGTTWLQSHYELYIDVKQHRTELLPLFTSCPESLSVY